MAINITSRDARGSIILPAGWYVIEVDSMTTAAAKTDGSTNYNYKLRVLGDVKGSDEFADVPVKQFLINEKGLFASGVAFSAALTLASMAAVEAMKKDRKAPALPIDENAPVGKQMKAKIQPSTYEGRTSNEAVDFLPL